MCYTIYHNIDFSWLPAVKSLGHTHIATALWPLRDWQFPPIAEVARRSPIGPGEVAEKSATSRGPRCDQISRSQVFEHVQKPGCDWFGRRQVRRGRRPVLDRSQTDRRLILLESGRGDLSLKLVGDLSAIGRRLIGDLSAPSLQLVVDL